MRRLVSELFAGRKLVIATKHKKESVIAPILSDFLQLQCVTCETLDTDLLGTFTGEIERKSDVIETARQKCLMALDQIDADMAVASEGSFGPDPLYGFANVDDEVLLFYDKKNNWEIFSREISYHTNFGGELFSDDQSMLAFAAKAGFPSHALIVKPGLKNNADIEKGITDLGTLKAAFKRVHDKYGVAFVETDMRALYNPTRMSVIRKAAEKLAKKITTLCPSCETPGFGPTGALPGLPCSFCNVPTKSTLALVCRCSSCGYTEETKYPHGKTHEDPTYCDFCNP